MLIILPGDVHTLEEPISHFTSASNLGRVSYPSVCGELLVDEEVLDQTALLLTSCYGELRRNG